MDQIEYLRELLYRELDAGDIGEVLKISQELDELIVIEMKKNEKKRKKSA